MNEARGIWFSHYYDENNQEHSFTLRQDDEDDGAFVERVVEFQQTLTSKGFFPKTRPASVPQAAEQMGGEVTAEIESIEVESIVLASGGEHPRWVVKGGWAKQYGITCWPEVLEEAGILDKLNPTEENKPSETWIAFYSKKPKKDDPSKMTADKVIRLERK